jgi:alpha-L-fucosidase 2
LATAIFAAIFCQCVFAELTLRIGADQNGQNQFTGKMERYSFHKTLTPDQIKTLAQQKPEAANGSNVDSAGVDSTSKLTLPTVIGAAEGWIYLDKNNKGNCRIFDRITPGQSDGWLLDLFPGRKLRLINHDTVLLSNSELPTEQWIHIAAVFNDNENAIYVNGKSVGSVSQPIISDSTPPQHSEIVWCSRPAAKWFDEIPLGNGRLGAMIAGNVFKETISLNEDTLWSGEPRLLQRPDNYKVLPEIRQLLRDGKNQEAQDKINATMLGPWQCAYVPLGDLTLTFPQETPTASATSSESDSQKVTDYRRELDLREGIAKSVYVIGGVKYERESFASFPDQVIAFHLHNNKPKSLSLNIMLSSQLKFTTLDNNGKPTVILTGNAPTIVNPYDRGIKNLEFENNKGIRFVQGIQIVSDGKYNVKDNTVSIADASDVKIYFTANNNYSDPWTHPDNSPENTKKLVKQVTDRLDHVAKKDFETLKREHLADYQSLYNRVRLEIAPTEAAAKPMEKRIHNFSLANDPQFAALYYQFGRYLLIAGSRPGSQPLNLQGIWNKDMIPAWASNWTLNCNAQINYWAVNTANLSELHEPFVRMTKELSVDGAKTAKSHYNARGWVAHHNADIWRTTMPVNGTGLWAIYQVGGAWLLHSCYDRYLFTGDKQYLADIYPVLKGACEFYLDTLQEDNYGYLTTNPATSFEQMYTRPDGFKGWATCGAIQDIQIVRALFRNTLDAAKILETDSEWQTQLETAIKKLAPNKVSPSRGDLQEWVEDWDFGSDAAQNPHGWALNPDWDISPITTPELAAAFRKTLERRKPWTLYNCASWVGSMSAGYWARLFDGGMTETVLQIHVNKSVNSSLISTFGGKGSGSWQNDGNLGMMSAIGETLLQSRPGQFGEMTEIHILPALLPSWKSGNVTGLRARGGFEVDITWTQEEVITTIRPLWGTNCKIRHANQIEDLKFTPNETKTLKWKRVVSARFF